QYVRHAVCHLAALDDGALYGRRNGAGESMECVARVCHRQIPRRCVGTLCGKGDGGRGHRTYAGAGLLANSRHSRRGALPDLGRAVYRLAPAARPEEATPELPDLETIS